MIETREVFRGRLGDRGLPSPSSSSCADLNPSPVRSRPAPHAEDTPPPPAFPSSRSQPFVLGRWGGGCAARRELGNDSEVSRAVLKPDYLKSLSSLLSLHFFFFFAGFWGESEWGSGWVSETAGLRGGRTQGASEWVTPDAGSGVGRFVGGRSLKGVGCTPTLFSSSLLGRRLDSRRWGLLLGVWETVG